MNKFAFFDIDNTIYNGYSTSDFYLFLINQGIGGEWIEKDDQRISKLYSSGKIDYSEASRQVVALQARALKNASVDKTLQLQHRFMSIKDRLFPWVTRLFKLLEENGFKIYLISAAAKPSVQAVADYLGISEFHASDLEIKNSKYTGEIKHMLNHEAKSKTTQNILANSKNKSFTLGFGDSTGDVDMLSNTDRAFVINPHQEELKMIAKQNNWHLVTNQTILSKVKAVLKNESILTSNL